MNLKSNAQVLFDNTTNFNNWATNDFKPMYHDNTNIYTNESNNIDMNLYEKNQFFKEIGQVRQDIVRFKSEINGLAKQMNGMELDLIHSKDRVYEIEKGLTDTQEVNVNLQVLLERAVNTQKESDVYATRAMKHIHTNLATVVHETGKLKGRVTTIAKYQKQHQGNVNDVVKRMNEYTCMLEQAHGTIQHLHNLHTVNKPELYRHRIIRKRSPESSPSLWLPQKGLRILLSDYQ